MKSHLRARSQQSAKGSYWDNNKKQGNAFAIERKKTILPVQVFIKNLSILYTNESVCKYSTNSSIMGHTYKMLDNKSCRTDYCIHLISCKICSKVYVGETSNLRKSNHRSIIKTKQTKIRERVRRDRPFQPQCSQIINGKIWQYM